MNLLPPNHDEPPNDFGSDSRDSVDLVLDGPGDTTVRPVRPSLLPLVQKERDRIARYQEKNQHSSEGG